MNISSHADAVRSSPHTLYPFPEPVDLLQGRGLCIPPSKRARGGSGRPRPADQNRSKGRRRTSILRTELEPDGTGMPKHTIGRTSRRSALRHVCSNRNQPRLSRRTQIMSDRPRRRWLRCDAEPCGLSDEGHRSSGGGVRIAPRRHREARGKNGPDEANFLTRLLQMTNQATCRCRFLSGAWAGMTFRSQRQ